MPTKLRAQLQRLLPSRRPSSAGKSQPLNGRLPHPTIDDDDDDENVYNNSDNQLQEVNKPATPTSPIDSTNSHSPPQPPLPSSLTLIPDDVRMPDRPRNGHKSSNLRVASPTSHHPPLRITDLISSQPDPNSQSSFNNNNTSAVLASSTPPPPSSNILNLPQRSTTSSPLGEATARRRDRTVDFDLSTPGIVQHSSNSVQLNKPLSDYSSSVDLSLAPTASNNSDPWLPDNQLQQYNNQVVNTTNILNQFQSSPLNPISVDNINESVDHEENHQNSFNPSSVDYRNEVNRDEHNRNIHFCHDSLSPIFKPAISNEDNTPGTSDEIGIDGTEKHSIHAIAVATDSNQFGDELFNDVESDTNITTTDANVNEEIGDGELGSKKNVKKDDVRQSVPGDTGFFDSIMPDGSHSDGSDDILMVSSAENSSAHGLSVSSASSSSQDSLSAVLSGTTPVSPHDQQTSQITNSEEHDSVLLESPRVSSRQQPEIEEDDEPSSRSPHLSHLHEELSTHQQQDEYRQPQHDQQQQWEEKEKQKEFQKQQERYDLLRRQQQELDDALSPRRSHQQFQEQSDHFDIQAGQQNQSPKQENDADTNDIMATASHNFSLPAQHTSLSPTPTSPGMSSPTTMTRIAAADQPTSPTADTNQESPNRRSASSAQVLTDYASARNTNEESPNRESGGSGHALLDYRSARINSSNRSIGRVNNKGLNGNGYDDDDDMENFASRSRSTSDNLPLRLQLLSSNDDDNEENLDIGSTKLQTQVHSTNRPSAAGRAGEDNRLINDSSMESASQFTAVYDSHDNTAEGINEGRSSDFVTTPGTSVNLNNTSSSSPTNSGLNMNSNGIGRHFGYHSRQNNNRRYSNNVSSHKVYRRARQLTHSLECAKTQQQAQSAITAIVTFIINAQDAVAFERQAALHETNALTHVLRLQSTYPMHAGVQAASAATISSLRLENELVMGARAVDGSLAALQIHRDDTEVLREVLLALDSVSRLKSIRKELFANAGVIDSVVVNAMKVHTDDVSIQIAAVKLLGHAAVKCERNQIDIVRSGALASALTTSIKFPRNRQYHMQLCLLIRNITVCENTTIHSTSVMIRGKSDDEQEGKGVGVVKILLECLRLHGHIYSIGLHAICALFHISSTREGTNSIISYQQFEQVFVHTASRHPSKVNIQTMCLAVMGRIVTAGGSSVARKLLDAGAVRLALGGMHRFVNRRNVLYYGAYMVRSTMQVLGDGMDEVIACGGVERLLDLLYCTVVTPASSNASSIIDEPLAGYAE